MPGKGKAGMKGKMMGTKRMTMVRSGSGRRMESRHGMDKMRSKSKGTM